MRARQRKKLFRQQVQRKVDAVCIRIIDGSREAPWLREAKSKKELEGTLYWLLFRADMAAYRSLGRPLFPGIYWIKTLNGPRMRWV